MSRILPGLKCMGPLCPEYLGKEPGMLADIGRNTQDQESASDNAKLSNRVVHHRL